MKVTGSPTKRNSEKAINPTASITNTACPRRRRMNASIAPLESRCVEIRKQPHPVAAPQRAPRPSLAGQPRSLSHLAFGGDAPADAGRRGHPVLRAVPAAVSHHEVTRGGGGGRGLALMERAGLLRARTQSAPRRTRDRAAREISRVF